MNARATRTRCAIYVRVSLDQTGEGLTLERHEAECRKIAQARGWQVIEVYGDTQSATDARKSRPAYERMLSDFDAGRFEALVVWDLDRLTRQPRQLEDWIDRAEKSAVKLVTANGEADLTTDGGRMYARIKAAVARAEVERKGARQASAARQRSEKGRPPLGVRLTGYTPSGELVPDEAEVVRAVFERFAAGDSLRSIARWLDEESGLTPRHGTRWSPSSVSTMLRNPRFAGHAVYRGEVTGVKGGWEPVVTEELFAVVQGILADPRRIKNRHGTDRKYLGSGIYICDTCERPVVSFSGAGAGPRYRCPNGHFTRTMRYIDEVVLAFMHEILSDRELVDVMIRHTMTARTDEAKELTKEATRLRRRIKVIQSDYDAELIDGHRYAVATEKVNAELAPIEARRAELVAGNGAAQILTAPDPVAAFEGASLMIQRSLIGSLLLVRITPAPRGSRTFKPETVKVKPRWGG